MSFLETVKGNKLVYRTFIKNATALQIETLAKAMIRQKSTKVTAGLLGVTYRCQYNCLHCGMGRYGIHRSKEMTLDQMKNAIDQIFDLNVVVLNLVGGEPLLREDLPQIVEYAASKGMMVKIDTNGFFLDDAKATDLQRARINNISVSLDAADPEKHDTFRGYKGAWEAAVRAIRACVNAGIPVTVGTYASRANIESDEIPKVVAMARELGASGVRVLLPTLSGQWLQSEHERLTHEEIEKVKTIIDHEFVYWNMFRKCLCAEKQTFYVSPYGDVQACAFIPISWGNISERPLREILDEIAAHPLITDVHPAMCIANDPQFREKYTVAIPDNVELPLPISAVS